MTVNRELQKLKSIIDKQRLQEDIKQLGEAEIRRGIISMSANRRKKESLRCRAPLAGYKLVKEEKKSLTSVAARNFRYHC